MSSSGGTAGWQHVYSRLFVISAAGPCGLLVCMLAVHLWHVFFSSFFFSLSNLFSYKGLAGSFFRLAWKKKKGVLGSGPRLGWQWAKGAPACLPRNLNKVIASTLMHGPADVKVITKNSFIQCSSTKPCDCGKASAATKHFQTTRIFWYLKLIKSI